MVDPIGTIKFVAVAAYIKTTAGIFWNGERVVGLPAAIDQIIRCKPQTVSTRRIGPGIVISPTRHAARIEGRTADHPGAKVDNAPMVTMPTDICDCCALLFAERPAGEHFVSLWLHQCLLTITLFDLFFAEGPPINGRHCNISVE